MLALPRRSEGLEQLARLRPLMKLLPGRRRLDEFHERESRDRLGPTRGEVECERGSPVLRNEHDLVEIESRDEGVEIADMVDKPVFDLRLSGPAEADQIRGDAPRARCNMRGDVAPELGRG